MTCMITDKVSYRETLFPQKLCTNLFIFQSELLSSSWHSPVHKVHSIRPSPFFRTNCKTHGRRFSINQKLSVDLITELRGYTGFMRAYTAQGNLQNKSSFVVNTQKFTILVFSPFVNQDILSFKYFTIRWVGRHSLQNMCIHYMYVSNFECMYLCIHEYWNCC